MSAPLGVVFFGSGPFAVPCLERLSRLDEAGSLCRLLRVVTRPDRPAGRGRRLTPTPVRARAAALGFPAAAPESANDAAFLDELRRSGGGGAPPDLFLVADYGEMLRQAFRSTPRLGAFNFHGSLLPRHRGAAPVAHAILAGDEATGVTLFRIEKDLDAGPIVAARRVAIEPRETAGELEARLAAHAADLLEEALRRFAAGPVAETPQDAASATLAPRLRKDDGWLDWRQDAVSLARRVRAFRPWPGAFAFLRRAAARPADERVLVHEASAIDESSVPVDPVTRARPAPGAIASWRAGGLQVVCGTGALDIVKLQRPGKAPLSAPEALRGWKLAGGERFESPPAAPPT